MALPLGPDDEHFLLLDVNPLSITQTDALIDWFQGGRHLEAWVRRSGLGTSPVPSPAAAVADEG